MIFYQPRRRRMLILRFGAKLFDMRPQRAGTFLQAPAGVVGAGERPRQPPPLALHRNGCCTHL